MTDSTAIDLLNGFTEQQKAECNLLCNNKVHTILQGRISTGDLQDAIDVSAHLNAMTQANIDANISPSLSGDNKLSQRPC
jgi:hypothetical protein